MQLNQLNLPFFRQLPNLATAGQLTPTHLAQLAKLGVKSLIFNRPDGEEEGQPSLSSLKKAAKTAGITFYHQPVTSGQVTLQEGQEFKRIYQELPKPVVAFCRTGARCGCLWALSKLGEETATHLIEQMQLAGFAMPDFFKQLKELE